MARIPALKWEHPDSQYYTATIGDRTYQVARYFHYNYSEGPDFWEWAVYRAGTDDVIAEDKIEYQTASQAKAACNRWRRTQYTVTTKN